jgi:hypothetical protein
MVEDDLLNLLLLPKLEIYGDLDDDSGRRQ